MYSKTRRHDYKNRQKATPRVEASQKNIQVDCALGLATTEYREDLNKLE